MKYKNPALPVSERVSDLLSMMTLEEKVAQLSQRGFGALTVKDSAVTDESLEKSFGDMSCGMLWTDYGADSSDNLIKWRDSQKYLRTKTRLGIPALTGEECLHGALWLGATIFPQSIALGATWNPDLIYKMGQAIAREASATGACQALSPLFDLARDPRYGRVEECYGECPTLVARCGVAFVKGMQGDDSRNGIAADKVMCTAKHFAGYSVPANGINIAPSSLGEREFRALHLPPFEAAVKEANIYSIMPSYNEVDGVPAHANSWLLTDILRKEWGFAGYVYSDWGGVTFNTDFHRIAADKPEAAAIAIKAGVDLEAPGPDCYQHLAALVRAGKVDEQLVNDSTARVLRMKFLLGLFDDRRKMEPDKLKSRLRTPEHVALSRLLADECIILLKNENNLLPLDASKLKSVAVIGPNADRVQFGGYCWSKDNKDGVTILAGLRRLLGDKIAINHSKGCELTDLSTAGFKDAVAAAKRSDVAIVVIGDTSMIFGGVGWGVLNTPDRGTVGEGYDVTDPVPPGVQYDLVKAIHVSGTPTIVVMLQGRPYSVPWMKQNVPAILSAFYPGEKQGDAIADIIFGHVNPSGRLPLTVPQSAGHIPTVYDYKPSGRGFYHDPGSPEKPGRDYVFSSPAPLWPFGFGLSYTTFEYRDLKIQTPVISSDGRVRLSFAVTNSGSCAGKEVAQVYYRDKVSSTTTPVMRLIRFQKVELEPGGSRTLTFEIHAKELALWNNDMVRVVEPGEFEIMVGDSAENICLRADFTVSN